MEQIKQNYNKYKQIKEENLLLQSAFKVKMTLFYIARTRSVTFLIVFLYSTEHSHRICFKSVRYIDLVDWLQLYCSVVGTSSIFTIEVLV
jgi:hypothetical protein